MTTNWQALWHTEVPAERRMGDCVVTPGGVVVRFQSAPLSPSAARILEGSGAVNGVWVVDMTSRQFIPAWVRGAAWRVLLDFSPHLAAYETQWRHVSRVDFVAWLNNESHMVIDTQLSWRRAKVISPQPCYLCSRPCRLVDPEMNQPAHKVCAEDFLRLGLPV